MPRRPPLLPAARLFEEGDRLTRDELKRSRATGQGIRQDLLVPVPNDQATRDRIIVTLPTAVGPADAVRAASRGRMASRIAKSVSLVAAALTKDISWAFAPSRPLPNRRPWSASFPGRNNRGPAGDPSSRRGVHNDWPWESPVENLVLKFQQSLP